MNRDRIVALRKHAQEMMRANNLAGARNVYLQICALDAGDADAWFRLGALHGELRDFGQAEACTRRAIDINPGFHEAYNNLASALDLQGRAEEAITVLEQVLAANPGRARAAGMLVRILEKNALYDRAYEAMRPFIEASVPDVNIALTFARISRHFGCHGAAIAYTQKMLESGRVGDPDRSRLYFSLGNLFDSVAEYDRAFECFSRANRMKNASFDIREHEQNVDRVIDRFTREYLDKLPGTSLATELPVFVVGMPRSGTTLIEQILSCHSAVTGAGELIALPGIVKQLSSDTDTAGMYLGSLDRLSGDNIDSIAKDYLAVLTGGAGHSQRIIDKLPGNFFRLGLISLLFPRAGIIHARRNALDTCLSCYFTDFRGYHEYSCDLEQLGRFYLQYARLMSHWRSVIDNPVLDVDYEELVNNQEPVSRGMTDFLGLGWEAGCLRFHESGRFARTASYDQVRQPVYTRSIGRWRHYEKHIGRLAGILEKAGWDTGIMA